MENIEYVQKMFQEFMKANNIKDDFSNLSRYQDMFIDWLADKATASRSYSELVDCMGIEEDSVSRRVVEFNKGIYDTAMIGLRDSLEVPPVVVSPYANTLQLITDIETANGRLVCQNNDVFVAYEQQTDYYEAPNCSDTYGDDIGTLLTQTPFSSHDLAPYLLLLDTDKTIFLGTNGNNSDKDKEANIEMLLQLQEQLQELEGILAECEVTEQHDSYLGALKIRRKDKVKRLVKIR